MGSTADHPPGNFEGQPAGRLHRLSVGYFTPQ